MKREIHVAVNKELPLDHAPFDFSLLPGDKDEYIITGGVFKGQRSFFTRDKSGAVKEVDRAGQVFSRVSTISEEAYTNLLRVGIPCRLQCSWRRQRGRDQRITSSGSLLAVVRKPKGCATSWNVL